MGFVLQVLGVIFLILLLLIALILFWGWRKARELMELDSLPDTQSRPSQIHLELVPNLAWQDPTHCEALRAELEQHGFNLGDAYTIEEISDIRLLSFYHPEEYCIAVLYEHDLLGVWVDLFVTYNDGSTTTISNATNSTNARETPDARKLLLKGASLQELLNTLRVEKIDKPLKAQDLHDFPALFESAYRREMVWRNKQGGITLEEVRQNVHRQGIQLDPEELQQTLQQVKQQELNHWHSEAIAHFVEHTTISVARWHRYEAGLFIYSAQLPAQLFARYLEEDIFSEYEFEPGLEEYARSQTTSADVLTWLLDELPEYDIEVAELGKVDYPIEATIYGYREE